MGQTWAKNEIGKRQTSQFEINLEDRMKIETIKEKTKTIIKKNQVIQVRKSHVLYFRWLKVIPSQI